MLWWYWQTIWCPPPQYLFKEIIPSVSSRLKGRIIAAGSIPRLPWWSFSLWVCFYVLYVICGHANALWRCANWDAKYHQVKRGHFPTGKASLEWIFYSSKVQVRNCQELGKCFAEACASSSNRSMLISRTMKRLLLGWACLSGTLLEQAWPIGFQSRVRKIWCG